MKMGDKLEAGKVFIEKEVVDWSQFTAMDTTQEDTPTCGIGENFDDKNVKEETIISKTQAQNQIKNVINLETNGIDCNENLESKSVVEVTLEQGHLEILDKDGDVVKDDGINDGESKFEEEKNAEECSVSVDTGRKEFSSSIVSTRKGTGTRLRRAEHQSGVPGVYWQESSQRWIAQWSDSISGRRITHGFSARVYGFEDAKQMAIKSRVDAIENGKATARKLHETSLTGKMYLNMNKPCYMSSQSEGSGVGMAGPHGHIGVSGGGGMVKGMRGAKYGQEYERHEYQQHPLKEDKSMMFHTMEKKNIQKIMNSMSDEGIGLLMEEMKHLKEDSEYEGIFWHPINKVWIGVWLDSITHETCTQSFPHEIGEDGIDVSRLKAIEWRLKLINEKKLRDNVVEYVNNKEFKYHNNGGYPGASGMSNSAVYGILNGYGGTSGILNPLNSSGGSSSSCSSSLINFGGVGFPALGGLSGHCNSNSGEFNSSRYCMQNGNYQVLLNQLMHCLCSNGGSFNAGLGTVCGGGASYGMAAGNIENSVVPDYNNMILSNMFLNGGAGAGILGVSNPNMYNFSNLNMNSMVSSYLNSYYGNMFKQHLFGECLESLAGGSKGSGNSSNNASSQGANSHPVDFGYLAASQMFNEAASENIARSKMVGSLMLGAGGVGTNGGGASLGGFPALNGVNLTSMLGMSQIPGAGNNMMNAFNGVSNNASASAITSTTSNGTGTSAAATAATSGSGSASNASSCGNQYLYGILHTLLGSGKLISPPSPVGGHYGSSSLESLDQIQNGPLGPSESGNNLLLNNFNQNLSQGQALTQTQQNNGVNLDINGMIRRIMSQEGGVSASRDGGGGLSEMVVGLENADSLGEVLGGYSHGIGHLLTSFDPSMSVSPNVNGSIENDNTVAVTGEGGGYLGSTASNLASGNSGSISDCVGNVGDDRKISRSVTSSSMESSISSGSTSFSMLKDPSSSVVVVEVSESATPTASSTPASSGSKVKSTSSPKKKNLGGISYKSGIPGVYWKTRDQEWVAEWYDQNRKRHSRHFYVKKYGFNEAKKLAIQCRLNAVNSGEAVLRSSGSNSNSSSSGQIQVSNHNMSGFCGVTNTIVDSKSNLKSNVVEEGQSSLKIPASSNVAPVAGSSSEAFGSSGASGDEEEGRFGASSSTSSGAKPREK